MAQNIIKTWITCQLAPTLGSVQVWDKIEYLDDDGAAIATKDVKRTPTSEELTALIGAQAAAALAANETLHGQNDALQAQVADLTAKLAQAKAALHAVAAADASWDTSPRGDVTNALEAIG
jgi:hypothetical protein